LQFHLEVYVKPGADAFVFTGPKGAMLRRSNFQRTWRKGLEKAGLTDRGLHFHDLRHTGNTLAAESASLRELMARMGHSSARAALVYQHASGDRERAIGAAISARIKAGRPEPNGHVAGTAPGSARKPAKVRRRGKRP
jgi:integrase